MTSSIHMYFYDKQRDIVIGDTVTLAHVKCGETCGERAKLVKIAQRYAEFESTSGSRVKAYAQSTRSGSTWYLGHSLPKGWKDDGWFIDVNPEREIVEKHPEYLARTKTGFEWRDR